MSPLTNQQLELEFIATVMTSIINDKPKHKIPNEGATKDSVWHNDTSVGLNVQRLMIIWINATIQRQRRHMTSLPACLKLGWAGSTSVKKNQGS